MTPAYFISGLGADERLFKKQIEDNLPIKVIPWLIPEKNETIEFYARRMSLQIPKNTEPVILGGVSFGGIMAIEMSRYISTKKIILISSVKNHLEIPFYIRMWKYFPIYKFIGGQFLKKGGILIRYIFGTMPLEEKSTFIKMVNDSNPEFIVWAADKICNWKNKIGCEGIIHLHGTSDLIFPIYKIRKPVFEIKGGTHIMVLTASAQVNNLLKKYIV